MVGWRKPWWRGPRGWALAVMAFGPTAAWSAPYDGRLTIRAVDEQARKPLAVRMELRDARGRPVRLRPDGAVVDGDSIFFDGQVTLELRRGAYAFQLEAGPEFTTRTGEFTIDRRAEDATEATLDRRVDMRAEGWWAGDLDAQLPLADVPLMMRARGIAVVPLAAAVNEHGRCTRPQLGDRAAGDGAAAELLYGPWTARDVRRGGGLLLVGGATPVDVCPWGADDPSLPVARAARDAGMAIVALSAAAWDLPIWIAAERLDAVQIIAAETPANAKGERPPPDRRLFPGDDGRGRYLESIYHRLLDCGLKVPPAAGSGAGQSAGRRETLGPLGTNRVYVHCGDACTREAWLEGLRRGRVAVTNGPLLRTRVEGHAPGHTFVLDPGERRQFQIALDLAFYSATQIEYLEIIQNGAVAHHVRLDELAGRGGRLPPVEFDASGWFLVRAVTNRPDAYEFATTGPYYVEAHDRPRISRTAVQYFLDWLDDAAGKFADHAAVVAEIDAARPFWQDLADRATDE